MKYATAERVAEVFALLGVLLFLGFPFVAYFWHWFSWPVFPIYYSALALFLIAIIAAETLEDGEEQDD